MLEVHQELGHLNAKKQVSDAERQQLEVFDRGFKQLENHKYNDIIKPYSNGNLRQGVELPESGQFLLFFDDKIINIVIEEDEYDYQCRIYDTEGGELSFASDSLDYLNKNINLHLNKLSHEDNSNIEFALNKVDFSTESGFSSKNIFNNLDQITLLTERQLLIEHSNIESNSEGISLVSLYDIGATINGERLSLQAIKDNRQWYKNIKIDPEILNNYLILLDSESAKEQREIKLIGEMVANENRVEEIISPHHNAMEYIEAIKAVKTIRKFANTSGDIHPSLWSKLRNITINSHRFQFISEKIGEGSQVLGMVTLSISTAVLLKRLKDPNVTEAQRREIYEQLAINISSASVNYGINILQPTFKKAYDICNQKLLLALGSKAEILGYRLGANLAKYATPALYAAAAGFDINTAIDNFTKASAEKNPDLKIDYLVNGSLASISAAISIATAAALALGVSAAGPIGIIVGATIMVGGMIYNAVRQVGYIKRKIELTDLQTFTTGIRAFIGLPPENDVQDMLNEESYWANIIGQANARFAQIIKPMGYDNYTYAAEEVVKTQEIMYVPVLKKDQELFVNLLKNNSIFFEQYILENKNRFGGYRDSNRSDDLSAAEIRKVLLTYNEPLSLERYLIMRYNSSPISEKELVFLKNKIDPDEYEFIDVKAINGNNRHVSDDVIIKNKELALKHPALTGFDYKLEYKNHDVLKETKNETQSNNGNVYYNLGGGNNIVVSDRNVSNGFDVKDGHNIFIGGVKNDIFHLMINANTSQDDHLIKTANIANHSNFLDGQGGSDTIILTEDIGDSSNYFIDLAQGHIKSAHNNHVIAKTENIENVVSHSAFNHILGTDQENYLELSSGNGVLLAGGNNDFLVLSNGDAYGGDGIDTYVINSGSNRENYVNIHEEETSRNDISNIMLNFTVKELSSVKLNGKNIVLSLEKLGNKTHVILNDVYCETTTSDLFLSSHKYIFHTSDNFILIFDPLPIMIDSRVENSFSFSAIYNDKIDRKLSENYTPKNIVLDSNGNMEINGNRVDFPSCIKPSLSGNEFTIDSIDGSEKNDTFMRISAGDIVSGQFGHDVYHIPTLSLSDVIDSNLITINCELQTDTYDKNKESTVTLIFADISGYDLNINYDHLNSALTINDYDHPDGFLKIKILDVENLFSSDDTKKITIIDKNKESFYVDLNNGIYTSLDNKNICDAVLTITDGDDYISINKNQRIKDKRLDTGSGNDVIVDKSGYNNRLSTGLGNDVIFVTLGYSHVYAGEGDDELFFEGGENQGNAGKGNDLLQSRGGNNTLDGGEGSDVYVIEYGKGLTQINDNHGSNKIILKGFIGDELYSYREADNLAIEVIDKEQKIIINNFFTLSQEESNDLYSFQINNDKFDDGSLMLYQYDDNLDALYVSMSSMSDPLLNKGTLARSDFKHMPGVQQPLTFLHSQNLSIAA